MASQASPETGERQRTGLFGIFAPDPPSPRIESDPQRAADLYRSWRRRILLTTIVGYAMFYFVRKNLGIAMPVMGKELGISKAQLGLFLTLHGVLYGVSKFANGVLGDRANARAFMVIGLLLSALTNVIFGFSSAVIVFGLVWMANGWFQGMGFPPCARLMTHWFSPKELATKMSIWNTSHSIGAGLVVVLCGYLVLYNWRLCFFVPAALAVAASIYLWVTLPDTPPSVGLPPVAGTESLGEEASADGATSHAEFRAFVLRHVFCNRYIWIIAFANFFVYTVRYAMLDWGPTFLSEAKGVDLRHAGWMVAAFEVSGVTGMLASGWITDRIFGGRGSRMCVFCMLATIGTIGLLWKAGNSVATSTIILCAAGFFIYGPQALVGITVANLATKRAAATAVGLTGIFGYASTVLSGWGLGLLVDKHGWAYGFLGMLVTSIIGAGLFLLAWPAKADGYSR